MTLSTEIETEVQRRYGARQEIEGLPEGFTYYSEGTGGGVVFHKPCQNIVARFSEEATPELMTKAAEDHWCPSAGSGIASG